MDVSIIIPTYNRLWSLPKAISSCFDTKLQIEVIVVDDGSTDGTSEWLNQQNNLVVIKQQNLGKDWAVNAGFKLAKGKYIRFLDSDDWLLPYSTDELFKTAITGNLDVVAAGHQVYTEDEVLKLDIPWTVCDDFIAQQMGECDSSHYSAYLFLKDFIADIPHRQEYGARDDRQFVIEVALKNPKVGYLTQATLAHRAHENERLQRVEGLKNSLNNLATLNIYKKSIATLEKNNQLTQRRKNAAINILWPLAHWVAIDHLQDGIEIEKWIKVLDPTFEIPANDPLKKVFNALGFKRTEQLLRLRRLIKRGVS